MAEPDRVRTHVPNAVPGDVNPNAYTSAEYSIDVKYKVNGPLMAGSRAQAR